MKDPFGGVSDSDIIPTVASVLNALNKDPTLLPRIMGLLPTEAHLKEAHERFQGTFNEVLSGGRDKASTRQDREALNKALTRFTALINLAAEEDPTLPQQVGLNPRPVKTTTVAHAPIAAPTGFRVTHGEEHGMIIGKVNSVKKARSYELEVCEGDPTVEENWKYIAVSVHCTKMEMKGLTPGKLYSFRVRAVTPIGKGPWSSYATLMAI
jgi:hypothetical protein